MSNVGNINYSTQHYSADCLGTADEAMTQARQEGATTQGLSTLLLSAMVAAVMVVTYQVMDTPAEGHLLMMWMTMWVVVFTALALLSGIARELARGLKSGLDAWSRKVARDRADDRLWAIARDNPELWADIQAAKMRAAAESAPVIAPVDRIVRLSPAAQGYFPRDYV